MGMVSENTLKQVQNVKLLEENNKRLKYLYVAECQTLIEYCVEHLRPIVEVALYPSMSRG